MWLEGWQARQPIRISVDETSVLESANDGENESATVQQFERKKR